MSDIYLTKLTGSQVQVMGTLLAAEVDGNRLTLTSTTATFHDMSVDHALGLAEDMRGRTSNRGDRNAIGSVRRKLEAFKSAEESKAAEAEAPTPAKANDKAAKGRTPRVEAALAKARAGAESDAEAPAADSPADAPAVTVKPWVSAHVETPADPAADVDPEDAEAVEGLVESAAAKVVSLADRRTGEQDYPEALAAVLGGTDGAAKVAREVVEDCEARGVKVTTMVGRVRHALNVQGHTAKADTLNMSPAKGDA